ncbi:MAG: sugar ABC transporter permease YjfF [Planctomycetes bacterium]|nr:sugar ABC transporter permease YjfF [Planctomycetota bacterium]
MKTAARAPWLLPALAFLLVWGAAGFVHEGVHSLPFLHNLVRDGAVLGVCALGATLVILGGGIDLAVGAMVGCAATLAAVLVEDAGWHPLAAAPVVVAAGAGFGALQAAAVAATRLPSFLVTLAGMFFLRGAALLVSRESVAIAHPFHQAAGTAVAWVAAAVALVSVVAAAHLPLLRDLYALGGHREAALLAGVRAFRAELCAFAASGACAALGGVLLTWKSAAGNPRAGLGLELEAIAAVVLGGTLLTGGRGGPLGTVFGVLVLTLVQVLLTFQSGLGPGWTRVVLGGLLLACVIPTLKRL